MALPSVAEMEAFIRAQAVALGIDPDVAVRVARAEGLQAGTWQSNETQPYGREASYGPFQLHVDPTGKRPGLGNEFMADTGLNPADPSTWDEGISYALGKVKEGGWGPWMGAKKIGVTGKMGVGDTPAPQTFPARPTDTVAQPGAGAIPDFSGGLLGTDVSPSQAEPTFGDTMTSLAPLISKTLGKRKKSVEVDPDLLKPQVFQPLRRYSTKGLLG